MMETITPTRHYSMNQAAEALGIHRNTLRRYADNGYIKRHYNRVNGRVYFEGAQLLRLQTIGY